jgi:hypothetical protein
VNHWWSNQPPAQSLLARATTPPDVDAHEKSGWNRLHFKKTQIPCDLLPEGNALQILDSNGMRSCAFSSALRLVKKKDSIPGHLMTWWALNVLGPPCKVLGETWVGGGLLVKRLHLLPARLHCAAAWQCGNWVLKLVNVVKRWVTANCEFSGERWGLQDGIWVTSGDVVVNAPALQPVWWQFGRQKSQSGLQEWHQHLITTSSESWRPFKTIAGAIVWQVQTRGSSSLMMKGRMAFGKTNLHDRLGPWSWFPPKSGDGSASRQKIASAKKKDGHRGLLGSPGPRWLALGDRQMPLVRGID